MPDTIFVRLNGIDELKRALEDLPEKIRKRAVQKALRSAAGVIKAEAKRLAPVLKTPEEGLRGPKYRKAGTVKKRISVRASKFSRRGGNEGVFIGVKPLRGKADAKKFGRASARNPNDPFYWWFLEFGTSKMRKRPFLGPAEKAKGQQAIERFMAEALPAIQKLNNKGA